MLNNSLATREVRRILLYLLVRYRAHLHLQGGRHMQVTYSNFVSVKFPLLQILSNNANRSFTFLHQTPFAFLSSSQILRASLIPFCFISSPQYYLVISSNRSALPIQSFPFSCSCLHFMSKYPENHQSFIYSPTDALESCFKNNIKIYIKTAPTCFGVSVTPSSGNALICAC